MISDVCSYLSSNHKPWVGSCQSKSQGTMHYSTKRAIVPYLNLPDLNDFQRNSSSFSLMILWGTSKKHELHSNHKEFTNTKALEMLHINNISKRIMYINHKEDGNFQFVNHQDANAYCCSGQPKSQTQWSVHVVARAQTARNVLVHDVTLVGTMVFRIVARITDLWFE